MNAWQTVLTAFGGSATLIVVLGYFGKTLLEKLIERDTKRFETDIQAKADLAIEHLKGQLQIHAIEHQVRFSGMHEKRAEVIAELYGLLVRAFWEAESFVSPMQWAGEPDIKVKHVTARNSLVELYRYFDKNRIYLPEPLCTSLEQLIRDVRSNVIQFGVWVEYEAGSLPDHAARQKQEAWEKSWEGIKSTIPPARAQLENEFRVLLGSSPTASSKN